MLVLSWYAVEPLASEVEAMLRSVQLPIRFRHIRQRRRLSQYCHLREGLAAFELEAPRDAAGVAASWLLFSDDDDLWHPRRAELARRACAQVSQANAKATGALSFGVYAYPVEEAAEAAESAAHVDRLLNQRQCGIWMGSSEVFQYAVRPALLKRFLRSTPEVVLAHRFADVRFATWMRQENSGAVRELDADALVLLDAAGKGGSGGGGGGGTDSVSTRDKERWLVSNWLYFYRNQRQLSAVTHMGDLEDLNEHLQAERNAKEAKAAAGAAAAAASTSDAAGAPEYERASTGRLENDADRDAARRLIRSLGPLPESAKARMREEDELTAEVGLMRHHAELTAMMCLGYSNAQELAIAICTQSDPGGGAAPPDSADSVLRGKLRAEQERLVREALTTFGHLQGRAALPIGSLQDVLR
jgi:hypothetical protein